MTDDKFEALINRLDFYARREPRQYRIQVGLLALLGYAFIFLMLGVLLALTVGLVVAMIQSGRVNVIGIKLGVFLLIGIGLVVRSLWVTIPPPTEPEITRGMAPRLFAMLDDVADTLQAPRFHHVQMTQEFNAGVLQIPKLGLLGFQVSYLHLGLPLMQALSPEQFKAVMAHEMGHLSANHSRFSGWIYRVRLTWFQLLQNLHGSGHKAAFLFTAFFNWYAPYFAAYSFVLARADEYVADRCAAEVSGAQTAGEALIQTTLQGRFFENAFWPKLLESAKESPQPPDSPVAALVSAFKEKRADDAERWYDEALESKTDLDDTHPSLAERLAALGFRRTSGGPLDLPRPPLPLPAPPAETAAEAFLGPALARFAPALDADWKRQIAPHWIEQHKEAVLSRRKLDLLDEQADRGEEPLSPAEAWERASLTAQLYGPEYATSLIHEIVQSQPDNAEANYALGRLLLKDNDPRGVPFVEKAMSLTPEAVAPGCELLYWFTRRGGRMAEAARYRERARQAQHEGEAGRREREDVGPGDTFIYHSLPPDELIRLRAQIAALAPVARAYLARKRVRYQPDRPLYVLGIVPTSSAGPGLAQWLGPRLQFPGETILVILAGDTRKLEKPLSKAPSALVFQR